MQIKDVIPGAGKTPADTAKADEPSPISTLKRDVNDVFENFLQRVEKGFGSLDWPWASGDAKSDMVETANAVEVSIELPGMAMEDIDVSVSHDVLTVKGEKKIERQDEKKGYYISERSYGSFYRAIPLPPGVDGDKAEASFKNGVLTVKLPQTAEAQAKAKRVEVKSA